MIKSRMRIKAQLSKKDWQINHFSIFAIFYMTAFLCEMIEKWKYIGFTWGFITLICILVFTKVTRLKFFIFLISSTAYILFFRFPEVANHVNLILILNFSLAAGIVSSWMEPESTDEDYFEMMLPFLRLSLVLIYFLAGFHKFNQDFFHPEVSCIGGFLSGFVWLLTQSTVLGVPSGLILMAGGAFLTVKLLRNPLKNLSRPIQFSLVMVLALVAVISHSLLVIMQSRFPTELKASVIFLVGGVVIAWELLGGLLLLIPRAQGAILTLSAIMHASFAFIGFVDFGSLAFALLFTFIPPAYLDVLDKNSRIKLSTFQVHRIYIYFLILLLSSFITGIYYQINSVFGDMNFLHGLILDFAAIVFFWPILSMLFFPQRLPWEGVSLFTQKLNAKIILVSALLLLFFGINPYLGLRTAGNFSMFSNLRTEGEYSNHLLLGKNPLKIWGYQEDVVEVLEIDDEAVAVGHKYRPLKGYKLPFVEFRKLIYKWTKANYIVPITFIHDGVTYSSQDIVNDPTWRTPRRNWEMYLMDFRVIQSEGPNQCRW